MKMSIRHFSRGMLPGISIVCILVGLILPATVSAQDAPPKPPGGREAGKRPRPTTERRGPWENDLHILTSSEGFRFTSQKRFVEGGGVASLIRDAKGILVSAFQWFPRDRKEDFDRIAVKTSTDNGATWSTPRRIRIDGLPEHYARPCDPTLVLLGDGRIRIYFTSDQREGKQPSRSAATYSAISSNGIDYTIEPGVRFAVSGKAVLDCAVARLGRRWHYYAPIPGSSNGAYHAVSKDGLTFKRKKDVMIEGQRKWLGCAVPTKEGLRFYGSGGRGGWCARSSDGFEWTLVENSNTGAMDPGVAQTRSGNYLLIGTGPRRTGPGGKRPVPGRNNFQRKPVNPAPGSAKTGEYHEFMLGFDQTKLSPHRIKRYDPPRYVKFGRLIDVADDDAWRNRHHGGGDFCRLLFFDGTFYAFLTDHPPGPSNIYYVRAFDQSWRPTGFEKRLTPPGERDIDQDIAFDGEFIYEFAMQPRAGRIRKFDKKFNLIEQTPVFDAGENEVILDQNIECYGGRIYAGSEYRENNDLWRQAQRQGGTQNIPPNVKVARSTHVRVFDRDLRLVEEKNLVANITASAIPNQYWALGASQFRAGNYHCVAAVSATGNVSHFDRGASIGARQLFVLRFDENLEFVDSKGPLSDTTCSSSWPTGSLYEDGRYYIVYCSRFPGDGHQYGPKGPPAGRRVRGMPGMGRIMLGIFDRNFHELETIALTSSGGNRPQLLKVGHKLYVTYDTTRGEALIQELSLRD